MIWFLEWQWCNFEFSPTGSSGDESEQENNKISISTVNINGE